MNKTLDLSPLGHTWIFDIDGTIVKHNGYKIDGHDTLLDGAKEFLDAIPKSDMVVLLTSRGDECIEETKKFLKENKIRYDALINNAPYGERILVNDKKPSGLEMSVAVNTERDVFMDAKVLVHEEW